jgi:hypothetical protein
LLKNRTEIEQKNPDSRKIPDAGLELREVISGALLREGGAQFAARHPE